MKLLPMKPQPPVTSTETMQTLSPRARPFRGAKGDNETPAQDTERGASQSRKSGPVKSPCAPRRDASSPFAPAKGRIVAFRGAKGDSERPNSGRKKPFLFFVDNRSATG